MFAATAFLLFTADVYAQKTDLVVLRNGDRFTCEVKQLSRGQLRISTDDAGTIYVEWDKIVSIKTAGQFEVTIETGARSVGILAPDTATTLHIVAQDGTVTPVVYMDIVAIDAIKTGFFDRIDGSLDVGGSYTKSSGVGQVSVSVDAAFRRPAFEVFSNFEGTHTRQPDEPTITRFTYRSGYTRFRDTWYVSPFLLLERNTDLGLDLRSAVALAVGRYLNRSASNTTLLSAGVAAGREQPIEGEDVTNVDALVIFGTSFYRFDYPRRNADFGLMVFPALKDWGRVRANANAKFRHELFKDFFASLTLYDTFDSRPEVEGADRNDVGVTFSLGWTF
jgi:hypothetical protein